VTRAHEGAMNRKAVALISGGLDSALAIHLVKKQGIEVVSVHFPSFFSPVDVSDPEASVFVLARQLGVPLILRNKGKEFLDIIRNPRYGHGKNINPCIDCRIHSFQLAKQIMHDVNASFLVTGEVVGQRPMSQRKDAIRLIEKQAGCSGLVVRPLSAKVLPPSIPEETGLLDREQFLSIAGRGRKVQLAMAAEMGLSGYSSPAGGCLLTEKSFAVRVRDLLADKEDVSQDELEILSCGRHIRVRPGLKIVVARNERENRTLERFSGAGTLYAPEEFPGPSCLAIGDPTPEERNLIGSIIRRYSKESTRGEEISVQPVLGNATVMNVTDCASDDWLAEHLL
jgi:tRNA-uridine 2-sulfurtransferase